MGEIAREVTDGRMLTIAFMKKAKEMLREIGCDEDDINESEYKNREEGEADILQQIEELKEYMSWDHEGEARYREQERREHSDKVVAEWMSHTYGVTGKTGVFQGKNYMVWQQRTTLGRDKEKAGLVYPPECNRISRVHCQYWYNAENKKMYLMDLGSTGGTYINNGIRLVPNREYVLEDGDVFYLVAPSESFKVNGPKGRV